MIFSNVYLMWLLGGLIVSYDLYKVLFRRRAIFGTYLKEQEKQLQKQKRRKRAEKQKHYSRPSDFEKANNFFPEARVLI